MSCVIDKDAPQSGALPAKTKLMLSPLGERLGEGDSKVRARLAAVARRA
jgi:hypothetical protein